MTFMRKSLAGIFGAYGGTLAALSASLLVPLGYDLRKRGEAFILAIAKWACTFVFLFLCLLWYVTQIIG
jgi:ABC-type xylose transport system permease subunit